MTKRESRELWWFAQGFLRAAEKLHSAAMNRDPKMQTKRAHFTKGAMVASMLLEGDLRRRREGK
jgi:hypothetical protein